MQTSNKESQNENFKNISKSQNNIYLFVAWERFERFSKFQFVFQCFWVALHWVGDQTSLFELVSLVWDKILFNSDKFSFGLLFFCSLIYIFHLCHFGLFNLCFCFVDYFSHSPTTPPHYQCRSISIRQVLYSIIHQRSHHHCITSSHPISSRPCCTRHKYLYRSKKYFSLCKS